VRRRKLIVSEEEKTSAKSISYPGLYTKRLKK
jgi:hypothetical protein